MSSTCKGSVSRLLWHNDLPGVSLQQDDTLLLRTQSRGFDSVKVKQQTKQANLPECNI